MRNTITLPAGRTGHRALRRLSDGCANMADLRAATGARSPNTAKKLAFLVGLLISRGLICRDLEGYHITDDGMAALEVLDGGRDFVIAPDAVPNVRVFGRAA